ncbi:MAG: hypothetical protein HGB22_08685 [Chlorobiaceae bacterium]|nr:hypothetical protein [Chlorobiaceae bacterium]
MISPSELLSIIAYCLFLAGAALSFQSGGSQSARLMMSAAVVLDMLMALLPSLGILPPMSHPGVNKSLVMCGVFLGLLVWILFAIALFLHHHPEPYNALILAVEILWFVDLMVFLYAVHR